MSKSRYQAMTPDEEWVMAVQPVPGRQRTYFMRLVRREHILIDGAIEVLRGETIRGRMIKARDEFASSRREFERAFHSNARRMGVPIPSYSRRGVTPFNCNKDEFDAIIAEWSARVPASLRANGYRVFMRWTEATEAIQL